MDSAIILDPCCRSSRKRNCYIEIVLAVEEDGLQNLLSNIWRNDLVREQANKWFANHLFCFIIKVPNDIDIAILFPLKDWVSVEGSLFEGSIELVHNSDNLAELLLWYIDRLMDLLMVFLASLAVIEDLDITNMLDLATVTRKTRIDFVIISIDLTLGCRIGEPCCHFVGQVVLCRIIRKE